jgi:hypothetical protein
MKIKSLPEVLGKKVAINLVLIDQKENRILSLQSEISGHSFSLTNREKTFVCSVPEGLPLVPSNYTLTYSIVVSGVTTDKLTQAIDFEIAPCNYFGSNLLPETDMGAVLIKNSWSQIEKP